MSQPNSYPRSAKPAGPPTPVAPLTLSIVIPALNEEDGIAEIVNRLDAIRESLPPVGIEELEIIVVDDGSSDNTAAVAGSLPRVRLLQHDGNMGYGAAIKTGFSQAKGELLGFLDADGTYPPEFFPELCRVALEHSADVVVGSRRSGADSQMPLVRRIGNFLWSQLVSLVGQRRCVDPASGMRVLRRSALSSLYPLPDGLNFTPVMSTRSVHEELKVVETPIPYRERTGRSKLTVVGDGTRFLKTILWTALEYNPVKILGLVGFGLLAFSFAIGLSLTLLRVQGVTALGPWGVFSVYAALISGVSGVSLYSLGLTFNCLVALFHKRPYRQGILRRSVFGRSLEPYLGWVGAVSIATGVTLAAAGMILGIQGWAIERLWLWLLGSALFTLVGLQMLISWLVARVLETLAERPRQIGLDLTGGRSIRGVEENRRRPVGDAAAG